MTVSQMWRCFAPLSHIKTVVIVKCFSVVTLHDAASVTYRPRACACVGSRPNTDMIIVGVCEILCLFECDLVVQAAVRDGGVACFYTCCCARCGCFVIKKCVILFLGSFFVLCALLRGMIVLGVL